MLKIQLISKYYSTQKILENIDVTFEEGKIHGVVGENGAGKTTLFRCLSGLEDFEGAVFFDKGNLKNVTGYLPTNPFFFSNLTAREYLRLICNARDIKIGDFENINIFSLPLHQYAEIYSTGMQKKLALTALLVQRNDVFILDEPFNGLDIVGNVLIVDILKRLRTLKKTIIMSSHIFSTLEESCDYLHYLKNGKLLFSVGKEDFGQIKVLLNSNEFDVGKLDSLSL